MAVTKVISWRTEGTRYRKSGIFLDVGVSTCSCVRGRALSFVPHTTPLLTSAVRSETLGAIEMKCYLSGMPELRLVLNDKDMFESTSRTARGKAIEMEDVKFHQCARLSRFENNRSIPFIPPDDEFELIPLPPPYTREAVDLGRGGGGES